MSDFCTSLVVPEAAKGLRKGLHSLLVVFGIALELQLTHLGTDHVSVTLGQIVIGITLLRCKGIFNKGAILWAIRAKTASNSACVVVARKSSFSA